MKAMEKVFLTFILAIFVGGPLMAQEEEVEITEEDLKAYASIQVAVDVISQSIKPSLLEMIEKQEGMTTKRYMELQKGQGEPAKEWETKFMGLIKEMAAKRSEAAKEVLNLIINNTTLTSAKYSKIKNSLDSDPDLKARYDAVTGDLM
ncbi:MAG: hypothetical protein ACOCXH_10705 [Cyclobacteriaceae bacterium]